MFDNKQESCVKRIHLVTDDGLYDQKAFYKVKLIFIHLLYCRRSSAFVTVANNSTYFNKEVCFTKRHRL